MNRRELEKKLETVSSELLRKKGYISYSDLFIALGYLELKDYEGWRFRRIPYLERVIRTNLSRISFIMGLQIADAVASSFFYAVQPSAYGFREGRYAQLLHPVVYHRHGTFIGYGVKLWPKESEDLVRAEKSFEWLTAYTGSGAQDPTREGLPFLRTT